MRRENVPKTATIGRCVWALKRKRTKSGSIKKYKARQNYNGSRDVQGVHYQESYAASASPTTQRMQLIVSGNEGLLVKQMDAEAAFTNGVLEREESNKQLTPLYMEQDANFNEGSKYPREQWVLKLLKSIYGTKQGARLWWQMLSEFYDNDGWTRSTHMQCMHYGIKIDSPQTHDPKLERLRGLRCSSYVTDDIITSISDHPIAIANYNQFKLRFFKQFPGDDLGDVLWYTNMMISRDQTGIYSISHKAYIEGMIEKQGLRQDEKSELPYSAHDMGLLNKLSYGDHAHDLGDQVPMEEYKSAVGAIGYPATKTHPEIAATWNTLTSYMKAGVPREAHLKAARKVIKFLNYTKRRSIKLDPGDMQITAGFDSDFATEREKRRSRGGRWIKIGNALVAWSSKLQSVTATSPAEAEYLELHAVVKDVKYVSLCLEEFGYYQNVKAHGGGRVVMWWA